jgi:5'-nucleotidase (lipoprotein e(P4) family)
MSRSTPRLLLAVACSLIVGIVVGRTGKTEQRADAQVAGAQGADAQGAATQARAAAPAFPMRSRVGANLYLQTSAEYQAACLQTYRCAARRLQELVESGAFGGGVPAVVMDLDETVFDNSAFQTYLYRTGQEYAEELWLNYERDFADDVTLIPGAKNFIRVAEALKVNVVFLSNRSEVNRASTIAALERLGVAGQKVGDRLFLKEKGASSDKSSRRDRVGARYNVAMLVGDNLRDFAEVFVASKLPSAPTPDDVLAAIAARKSEVERAWVHWGTDWFILPNPVYGEWDKLIQVDPLTLMHPTTMATQR